MSIEKKTVCKVIVLCGRGNTKMKKGIAIVLGLSMIFGINAYAVDIENMSLEEIKEAYYQLESENAALEEQIKDLKAAEADYSYLDDMTINGLKALDEEIHKRLPTQADDMEDSNDDTYEILKSDKWMDLLKVEPDISFFDAGIVSYGNNSYSWEIVDSTIIVSNSSINKGYVLEEESGIPKLSSVTSSSIYVRETDYESALEVLDIPEEFRVLSYDEILEKSEDQDLKTMMVKRYNNTVEAEQEYLGNIYTVLGVVSRVYKDYVMIEPIGKDIMGFFEVYFVNKEDFLDLKPNKIIRVAGKINGITPASIQMKNAYLIN